MIGLLLIDIQRKPLKGLTRFTEAEAEEEGNVAIFIEHISNYYYICWKSIRITQTTH